MFSLSHTMGNAALADLIASREAGPATAEITLPRGACGTAPAMWGGGMPALTETPAFGAMTSISPAAPLAV